MSGRKNHHIPQLLQRGFGTPTRKTFQVWVYSRDRDPFLTSTNNFGAERDFYIDGDDSAVDDLITDFEGDVAGYINQLRERVPDALSDVESVATLIAHLEMRSKFIREEMLFLSGSLFNELRSHLNSPKSAVRLIRRSLAQNPSLMDEKLDELQLSDADRQLADAFLDSNLSDFIEANAGDFIDQLQPVLDILVGQLSEVVKNAHLRALSADFRKVGRRDAYINMNYRYVDSDSSAFIMPDTIVAFVQKDGRISPFLEGKSGVSELFLPISSRFLVHGCFGLPLDRDILTINRILASCSSKNFLSSECSDAAAALAARIGRNAAMFPRKKLRKMVREILH